MSYQYQCGISNPQEPTVVRRSFMLETRVIHDSHQVRRPSQLKKGASYRRMQKIGGKTRFQEVFEFLGRSKRGRIKINQSPFQKEGSLADMGVISYKNGLWNSRNYIIPWN